jgi:hypothetical protein
LKATQDAQRATQSNVFWLKLDAIKHHGWQFIITFDESWFDHHQNMSRSGFAPRCNRLRLSLIWQGLNDMKSEPNLGNEHHAVRKLNDMPLPLRDDICRTQPDRPCSIVRENSSHARYPCRFNACELGGGVGARKKNKQSKQTIYARRAGWRMFLSASAWRGEVLRMSDGQLWERWFVGLHLGLPNGAMRCRLSMGSTC